MCSTAWREKGLLRMWMDVEKAVFEAYAISVALLVIKVMAMGPLTARQRFKHMVMKIQFWYFRVRNATHGPQEPQVWMKTCA